MKRSGRARRKSPYAPVYVGIGSIRHAIARFLNSSGFSLTIVDPDQCWVVTLPAPYRHWLSGLSMISRDDIAKLALLAAATIILLFFVFTHVR